MKLQENEIQIDQTDVLDIVGTILTNGESVLIKYYNKSGVRVKQHTIDIGTLQLHKKIIDKLGL